MIMKARDVMLKLLLHKLIIKYSWSVTGWYKIKGAWEDNMQLFQQYPQDFRRCFFYGRKMYTLLYTLSTRTVQAMVCLPTVSTKQSKYCCFSRKSQGVRFFWDVKDNLHRLFSFEGVGVPTCSSFSCSPDLVPLNFYLFLKMIISLRGRDFVHDLEVLNQFRHTEGINKLNSVWTKCVSLGVKHWKTGILSISPIVRLLYHSEPTVRRAL